MNCAIDTVTEGLMRAQAGPGDAVVTRGTGGLGVNTTGVARHLDVDQIITLDRQPKRLALATAFGANETINIDEYGTKEALLARVQELTHGLGASVAMDLVGNAGILEEAIPMWRSGGRFVQIGAMAADQSASIFPSQLLRGKTIIGSLLYRP